MQLNSITHDDKTDFISNAQAVLVLDTPNLFLIVQRDPQDAPFTKAQIEAGRALMHRS